MRPTGNPYRLAPPRALAPAPLWRWPTWCLDVVGAAYVLRWSRQARRLDWAAHARDPDWLWRYRRLGPWGWPPPPHVDPTPTICLSAADFAEVDRAAPTPRVRVDLTGAPPKVATGEVEVPSRLVIPPGEGWCAEAVQMFRDDEARANARKE